jgi:branched-chain amino acid transport system ATP-binding protein
MEHERYVFIFYVSSIIKSTPKDGLKLLEVNNVSISFGGLKALDDCCLDVEEKTIVGLIGPNGAGKTTLLNVISGLYRQDSGHVIFRGRNIDNMPTYKRVLQGIAMTFQIPRELYRLTVLETMLLCRKKQKGENARARRLQEGL